MRACGRSRFNLRIDCRACATASLVTAQLLMTIVSESPACSASRRITSDSNALRRQPKVMTSTLMRRWRTAARIEAALIFEIGGAGHQHMIVALAPFIDSLPPGRVISTSRFVRFAGRPRTSRSAWQRGPA